MADASDGFSTSIGGRLKAARQAREMSLEDVASKTRIPTRHLLAIEQGDWDALPAPTYSVGFARAYANAIGMNGPEVGQEVRALIGRGAKTQTAQNFYEPADPARVPPRSLAIAAAVIALLLVIGYAIWRSNTLGDADLQETAAGIDAAPVAPVPVAGAPQPPAPAASTQGPVVLTAAEDVWLRVSDGAAGGALIERTLKAGERFEVPATARAPQIVTSRPNVLRITVGATQVPPLGPPERRVAGISLLPADLLASAGAAAPPAR